MRSLHRLPRTLGLALACSLAGGAAIAPTAGHAAGRPQVARPRTYVKRPYRPRARTPLPASYPIAGNHYLSPEEYLDLRNGCVALLERFPPDRFYFVGLGRDPAPVIAFLQNLGDQDLAVSLPGTSAIKWATNADLSEADVARHIEAAIPAAVLDGERQIVLLDVTTSGKTPAIFGAYMDRYLAARGNPRTARRLAMSWNDLMSDPRFGHSPGAAPEYGHLPKLTDWIDTTPFPDFAKYPFGKYEGNGVNGAPYGWSPSTPEGGGIAEHQRHEMGPGVRPPTRTNPAYAAFRRALRERMERDHELDVFLAGLGEAGPTEPAQASAPWRPRLRWWRTAPSGSEPLLTLPDPRSAPGPAAAEPATFAYLGQAEYDQLSQGARELLRLDPRTHYYVGVGRSSTALIALLQNVGQDVATYLPVDGLDELAATGLRGAARKDLDALLAAFLPAEVLRGGRTVVLFQQAEGGASLRFLGSAVRDYLRRHGSATAVETAGFGAEPTEVDHGFSTVGRPHLGELDGPAYRAVAPYAGHRLGEGAAPIDRAGRPQPTSVEWSRFAHAMERRVGRDRALGALIAGFDRDP